MKRQTNTEPSRNDVQSGGDTDSRKPYQAPVLTDHGTMEQFTQNYMNNAGGPDSGSS